MGALSQAKILGGIGAILTLLLFVPFFVGTALVIIGWVFILLAIKNVSEVLQDRTIYSNAMISVVTAIAGVTVFAIVVAGAIFGFIGLGSIASRTSSPVSIAQGLGGLVATVIGGLVVVWILAIVSAYFLRRSYYGVATRLNVNLFRTGALIYFIGAIPTVIGVGFILLFVAQIIFVVA